MGSQGAAVSGVSGWNGSPGLRELCRGRPEGHVQVQGALATSGLGVPHLLRQGRGGERQTADRLRHLQDDALAPTWRQET